jgi:hypothetical protein
MRIIPVYVYVRTCRSEGTVLQRGDMRAPLVLVYTTLLTFSMPLRCDLA